LGAGGGAGAGFFGGGLTGPARQTTPSPATAIASPPDPEPPGPIEAYAQLSAGARAAAVAPAAGEPASQASASTATARMTRVDLDLLDPYTTEIMGGRGCRHARPTEDCPEGGEMRGAMFARGHRGARVTRTGRVPRPLVERIFRRR